MRNGVAPLESRGGPAGWGASLARQTRERPGRTIAVTVATGFVLGGGLFSPLTVRLLGAGLRLGLRFALLPMVAERLAAFGEAGFKPGRNGSASVADSSKPDSKTPKKETRA